MQSKWIATRTRRPLAGLWICALLLGCAGESGSDGDGPASGCQRDSECPAAEAPCKIGRCEADGSCAIVDHVGASCDDGDVCTVGDRCDKGACLAGGNICGCKTTADCTTLDDANLCNGSMFCDLKQSPSQCRINPATMVDCGSAGNTACKAQTCQPDTGKCALQPVTDGTPCDDGKVCTLGDACSGGTCTSAADICQCAVDADCSDDGDACNGTNYCDMSKLPWRCAPNPATVVNCSDASDTACSKNNCDPKTGKCAMTPAKDGDDCDDGDPCTNGDGCKAGKCVAGTEDVCKCSTTADCAKEEDGDACNGTLYCDKGTGECKLNKATLVTCPTAAETACLKNACFPATGLCQLTPTEQTEKKCDKAGCHWQLKAPGTPIGAPPACDDDNTCTKGEVCKAGACTAGSIICWCKTDGDCADQDDGDLCNGVMFCNQQNGKCELNPASKVVCPTVGNTTCRHNLCQAKTGKCLMTPVDENKACDDDNPCTTGDLCQSGKCVGGVNTCECWLDADCAAKEDGNACNGTLYCDKTGKDKNGKPAPKCVLNPASKVACNKQPASPCLVSLCDPTSGKCVDGPGNDKGPCDDGSACTSADACTGGACLGQAVKCDDDNPCTNDSCKKATGCVHAMESCADGNGCTQDLCDAKTGKCGFDAKAKDGAACDADQSGCTLNDTCKSGSCIAGAQVICPPKSGQCQQAYCVPTGATSHTCKQGAKPDGATCKATGQCIVGGGCKAGACLAKAKYFARSMAPPLTSGTFYDVAAMADGGVVAVGRTWKGAIDKPSTSNWWLVRTNEAGDPTWQDQFGGDSVHMEQRARAVQVAGGAIYACGAVTTQGQGLNALVARWGDKKKAQWSKQVGTAAGDEVALAMHVDPVGPTTLAGWRQLSGWRRAWVVRVGANEQQVWALEHGAKGDHVMAVSLAARPGGAVLVGGRHTAANGLRQGLLLEVDSKGAITWQALLGGKVHRLADVAVTASNTFAVAGWRDPAGGHNPWLAGGPLPMAGPLSWQHQPQAKGSLHAIASAEAGRLVQVGQITPLGGKPAAWVMGSDALGNTRWSRTLQPGDASRAEGVAFLGADGVVVVGRATVAGAEHGLLARLDPWGHDSCALAGKCLDKPLAGCADENPCTADLCDGKSGCKNAAVENLLCDPADGCSTLSACAQGKCPATEQGRLFRSDWDLGGKASVARAVAMPGGGWAFVGQANPPATHGVLVGRVDSMGTLLWHNTYVTSKASTVGLALQPTADGGLLVVDMSNMTGMRRFSADGKTLWSHAYDWFKGFRLHDLVRLKDGGHALVLQVAASSKVWPRVWKINDKGTAVWKSNNIVTGYEGQNQLHLHGSAKGTNTGAPIWAVRADEAPGGDIFLAGSLRPDVTKYVYFQGWMGRVSKAGAVMWNHHYDGGKAKPDEFLFDLVALSGGGALAVGERRYDANKSHGYLLRVDDAGKKVWERFDSQGGQYVYASIAQVADGSLVIGGTATLTGFKKMWLMAMDVQGNGIWQRNYAENGRISSITPLTGGDLLLGATTLGAKTAATLMRTDRWGHPGCKAAGSCLTPKPAACDDKKACTADSCDAVNGCVNTPIPGCGG